MEESIPFIDLEIKLIEDCTDLKPEEWIRIYAQRFREIVESDPNLTEYQVKYQLYMNK